MQEVKTKLQAAFSRGFIPEDIKTTMDANGHEGNVWIVENDDEDRVGVGYKLASENGPEESHINWYTLEEAEAILQKVG